MLSQRPVKPVAGLFATVGATSATVARLARMAAVAADPIRLRRFMSTIPLDPGTPTDVGARRLVACM
jgi:hypothetical protein